MSTIDNTQDVMDSRDIVERIEELRAELGAVHEQQVEDGETNLDFDDWRKAVRANQSPAHADENWDTEEELRHLEDLAEQLEGYGDWDHGETLIRESHFQDYAQELAEDCGMVTAGASWPNNCIDWEEATRQLRQDYTEADFDGVTYLMRA